METKLIELSPVKILNVKRNLILKNLEFQLSLIESQTRFVGLTYTAKKTGETARFTVLIGIDYLNAIKQSQTELEITLPTLTGVERQACQELLDSFQNTLDNAEIGKPNDAYTKKGVYRQITVGLQENLNDGTVEIKGLVQSKKVLVEGIYKSVKSSDLTIAKNKLRSLTRVGKYRTFCVDLDNLHGVRINGNTLELD